MRSGCSQSESAQGFLPKCPPIVLWLSLDSHQILNCTQNVLGFSVRSPQINRCETARQCCVMSVQSALDVSANYICDALQPWRHDIHLVLYIMGAEYMLHFLTEAVGSLCAGVCQLEWNSSGQRKEGMPRMGGGGGVVVPCCSSMNQRQGICAKSSNTQRLLKSKLWPVSVFDDALFCCWHPMPQIPMIWELLGVENIALMTRGDQLDLITTSFKQAKKLSNKIDDIEQQKWLGAAVDSSCNSS